MFMSLLINATNKHTSKASKLKTSNFRQDEWHLHRVITAADREPDGQRATLSWLDPISAHFIPFRPVQLADTRLIFHVPLAQFRVGEKRMDVLSIYEFSLIY